MLRELVILLVLAVVVTLVAEALGAVNTGTSLTFGAIAFVFGVAVAIARPGRP